MLQAAPNSTNHDTRSFVMDYSARSMPPAGGSNKSFLGGGRYSLVCANVPAISLSHGLIGSAHSSA